MIRISCVDAFTDRPFAGNPAAVCCLQGRKGAGWMQQVAREMNLPETAFLFPHGEGYRLRWFTPRIEVDLCGHGTLASAHVLWEQGFWDPDLAIRFSTKSGLLTAKKRGSWIWLDFPAEPESPVPVPDGLSEALGVHPLYVGKNRFDYIIEVESESVIRKMRPDFGMLSKIPARGFIVTSRAEKSSFDFVSRFFAPALGINEDPVTGSAHCCLAPFWQKFLDRPEFVAYQASERGGEVRVRVEGDRVKLGGQAVTIWSGELAGKI
jgi:PhzF family phenazine biosynthesis protein